MLSKVSLIVLVVVLTACNTRSPGTAFGSLLAWCFIGGISIAVYRFVTRRRGVEYRSYPPPSTHPMAGQYQQQHHHRQHQGGGNVGSGYQQHHGGYGHGHGAPGAGVGGGMGPTGSAFLGGMGGAMVGNALLGGHGHGHHDIHHYHHDSHGHGESGNAGTGDGSYGEAQSSEGGGFWSDVGDGIADPFGFDGGES